MKIIVKAKPNAQDNTVEQTGAYEYAVRVAAPPVDGKANAAIIKTLAKYFDISPSLVEIISGHLSKIKVVEIHMG